MPEISAGTGKKYSETIEYILTLNVLFFISRSAIPIFKYPFLILYTLSFVYAIYTFRAELFGRLLRYIIDNYLILILILLIIMSSAFSEKIYLMVFKDTLNALIIFSIFFLTSLFITSEKDLDGYITKFINLLFIFSVIIVINSLFFSANDFNGNHLAEDFNLPDSFAADYLNVDYNFALLPVFFGIVIILANLTTTRNPVLHMIMYNFLLLLFTIQIIISTSRRGFVMLLLVLGVILVFQIIPYIKKNEFICRFNRISRIYLISIIVVFPLILIAFFNTNYTFKNRVIKTAGTDNLLLTKTRISKTLYRYVSVFNKNIDYNKFYLALWKPGFDPADPESIWGSGFHKTLTTLPGKNNSIVPKGSKGYLIDSTCFQRPFPEVDGTSFNTLIQKISANGNEKYSVSIYCYASMEFDGISIRFQPGWDAILNNKTVDDYSIASYDMGKKGIWQKLEFEFTGNGVVPVYVTIDRKEGGKFSSLKGNVVFAYPEIGMTEQGNKGIKSSGFLGEANFFSSLSDLKIFQNEQDKDPIRKCIAQIVEEDTTYYPYFKSKNTNISSTGYFSTRSPRWLFAMEIFNEEYSGWQKAFGGGFNFLNWYGYYFLKDKKLTDYPHNPFLSILLYSGILGLVVYCIFLYKVFYYYFRIMKRYAILCIFFIMTFFFSFFSGISPFDPPVMGFFIMLPFFMHNLLRNQQ